VFVDSNRANSQLIVFLMQYITLGTQVTELMLTLTVFSFQLVISLSQLQHCKSHAVYTARVQHVHSMAFQLNLTQFINTK